MSFAPMNSVISFGPFRLHPMQRLLFDGGQPVRIGSRAMDVLVCLVERAGQLVSKEELLRRAWPNTTIEENNIRVQVATLRRLLDDGRNGNRYILNIPGRGYWFVASVATSSGSSAALMSSMRAEGSGTIPGTLDAKGA